MTLQQRFRDTRLQARKIWALSLPYFQSEEKWRARGLLAGIVALSTYVVRPDLLAGEASPANRDVPIFMAHGTADPMVRLEWGEAGHRALVAAGYRVEWHTYPMPHSVVW